MTVMILLIASGTGCGSLPESIERAESRTISDTNETAVGLWVDSALGELDTPVAYLPLASGINALVARAALAREAERSIDTQYYLLHDDLTGRLFQHELFEAADRGVRVRLLVDDMAIPGRDAQMAALAAHPNFHVRIFNPFWRNAPRLTQYVTRFGSVTRRMHNKSFTVDNQASILGGRNIGDEYFGANPAIAFRDLDVLLAGTVVHDVSATFDAYWNSDLSYPIGELADQSPDYRPYREELARFAQEQRDSPYMKALAHSDLARRIQDGTLALYDGDATIVADEPDKILADRKDRGTHLLPTLQPFFEGLGNELIIISAYFVPGRAGTEFLIGLRRQGIRVRVLTNGLSSTDVAVVHAGYSRYRRDLLEAGVELHELKSDSPGETAGKHPGGGLAGSGFAGSSVAGLHAKSFVLDRTHAFIGSLNLDPRSATENTEIGVVMKSPDMAAQMGQWFDDNIDRVAYRLRLAGPDGGHNELQWVDTKPDGAVSILHTEPHTGFWRRFLVGALRWLPFESQL